MGFKIKNSLTGEFEKLPILTLKGEKGETGGVEEYNKVDYMGNKYKTLKQANDANVEYAVKTAIGEFNYLDYEGQHITAQDTIAGQAKNAIVEGNTLVNVLNYKAMANSNDGASYTYDGKYLTNPNPTDHSPWGNMKSVSNLIKPNTTYLVKLYNPSSVEIRLQLAFININSTTIYNAYISSGERQTLQFASPSDANGLYLKFFSSDTATPNIKLQIMILEYQEGMEEWDIPYFEGMASCKMPILKSVGKNLLSLRDGATINGNGLTFTVVNGRVFVNGTATGIVDLYTNYVSDGLLNFFNTRPLGTSLTLSNDLGKTNYWGVKRGGSTSDTWLIDSITIASGDTDMRCFIRFETGDSYNNQELNIMLEYGTAATPYEPYKSNILTMPEDLELRGIGNVKDELNVATGELTQRIGEVVFDGSEDENWHMDMVSNNDTRLNMTFKVGLDNIIDCDFATTGILCDKFTQISGSSLWINDVQGIGSSNGSGLKIGIPKSNLTTQDVNGFRYWLSQNPVTVQYQLATESIKTVDLSDNHVYSYQETTHYDCSSAEGSLVPTLSVKVPTDVQATIAQQRETIQTLNSENERLNQIQEALKASMLDSQVQLMNLSWDAAFEVFTLRESIAPKDLPMNSRTGSNIDKFSQAKFIIENDCPDLEKLNSQIEYYFSKDVFSQEQFEELTDLISIVKGENSCEY